MSVRFNPIGLSPYVYRTLKAGVTNATVCPVHAPENVTGDVVLFERDSVRTGQMNFGGMGVTVTFVVVCITEEYDRGIELANEVVTALTSNQSQYRCKINNAQEYYKDNKFEQLLEFEINNY